MKVIFFLLFACTSCTAMYHYDYKTSLKGSIDNEKMSYEDDSVRISFLVDPKYIAFRLDNKLPEPITINWDELSFLIDKEHHKLMRTDLGVFKEYERQYPTVIPGGSYSSSQLVPVRNIKTSEIEFNTKVLSVVDFLPNDDHGDKALAAKIQGMKGTVLEIKLPLYIRGKSVAKTFYISIDDIRATKTGSKTFLQKS